MDDKTSGPGSPSEAAAAADQAEPETVEEERYQLPPSQYEIPNTVSLDNELVRRLEHPEEFTDEA